MKDLPNINALWGTLLVEELLRQGVARFVVAPGSRSAPLAVAVAQRVPRDRCQLCVDERAAGYFALGAARASGQPVAVITTSGTAVANLLPAVVEASIEGVPLLLLTADRPPELRDCGAPQTIQQPGILGDHVRWQHDLPAPDDRVPARSVLTAAAHAVAQARGPGTGAGGPVHLNCMFREPLAPTPRAWDPACLAGTDAWQDSALPFTRHDRPAMLPTAADLEDQAAFLAAARSGLVLVAAPAADRGAAALALAQHLGWPLWPDVRSGLRLGHPDETAILPHLDQVLAAGHAPRPDVVVQLGGRITAKRMQQFVDEGCSSIVLVAPQADRLDPGHRAAWRVQAPTDSWCRALAERVPARTAGDELAALQSGNARVEAAIAAELDTGGPLGEPFVARWLTRHAAADSDLFLSSSMPIRDVQSFGAVDGPTLAVASNRGASGIDGVLASAVGFAAGSGRPLTLLIGDLALLHDLGSLALLRDAGPDRTVIAVVLNNGGGSIFSMLPIAQSEAFTPWFDTPHRTHFAGAAADFGIAYAAIESRAALIDQYRAAQRRGGPTLLEVHSSQAANHTDHQRLQRAIDGALGGATDDAPGADEA